MVQCQAENGTSALCLREWHVLEEETWNCVLTRAGLLGQCCGVGGEGLRFPRVKQGAWGVTDMRRNSRAAGRMPGCGWHLPRALVLSVWVNRASRGSGTGLPPELTAPPVHITSLPPGVSPEQEPSLGCLPEGWDPYGSRPREALDDYLSVNRVHL